MLPDIIKQKYMKGIKLATLVKMFNLLTIFAFRYMVKVFLWIKLVVRIVRTFAKVILASNFLYNH